MPSLAHAHPDFAAIIDHLYIYEDGILNEELTVRSPKELAEVISTCETGDNRFLWLSLVEPSNAQMQDIAEHIALHELITEDAVTAHQRPKVERYDDQLFVVVRSVKYTDFDINEESVVRTRQVISTGEVQMVVGPRSIITIRHNTPLPDVAKRLVHQDTTSYGPMAIAWAMSDCLVDDYMMISRELTKDVDELEEEVFTPQSDFSIDQIYLLKREILEMRHAIDPLAPALRSLLGNNADLIDDQIHSYFRDVLDHEIVAKDEIASCDERLTNLITAAVAKVTLQQNTDMRSISAFVGMAAVPTLVAGIYGMNFANMPELETQYGYFIVLAIMVSLVIAMWLAFKKWNWL
ncbi:magnesium and cobalt transport protein CorA [Corynebacterium sp. ES2794-CONJ1]|uniref:magnesium and cobalt transport protein CorA n=1 Tax=unclassified Corynebacterium TaxID=2624378 RepID=UPI002168080F|nr:MULTISPECIES: magnesium and cobalt transport protein CorA [unclassified Corynebacterium]MCS4489367.1 magnesium and cobalt transport protein CorA [Corynebacterium sp. ES2775-CONJ]MCS4491180.1 magnesium and cobalt transport protein CorA [Corynebacterium sp. ES2715-CONJ3]MCS4530939.1 magnesium and cobalt transport protein CorA [Corynebacterium sp. ES2730-CONJ]MCU9518306.1 magnesium and cobalt transport protein CorA [Corynebacterium sp. ES2794-CONJ1]